MTLERGQTAVMFKRMPAEVCENCQMAMKSYPSYASITAARNAV